MIVIKYTLFASISTTINLLFQYLSFFSYTGFYSFYVALFIGTLAGLASKYFLDKKYIFYHIPENKIDETKKIILYSFTGVFTTVIFWGTEIWFDYFFERESSKYIGAVIGLGIGYIIKYYLDKKYVFKDANYESS